jgi:hypothetical protein
MQSWFVKRVIEARWAVSRGDSRETAKRTINTLV